MFNSKMRSALYKCNRLYANLRRLRILSCRKSERKTLLQSEKDDGSGFGVRHRQAIMTCLGMTLAYALRVNISVGIVAMTDPDAGNPHYPVLNWDTSIKGTILSSFFWGYFVLQIPAGQLARTVGPRYLLAGALMFCGIMTIIIPPVALTGSWFAICVARIAQGLGQGFIYPSINAHVAKWAPPREKSRTFAFVFGVFGDAVAADLSWPARQSRGVEYLSDSTVLGSRERSPVLSCRCGHSHRTKGTPIGSTVSLFGAGLLAAGPGGWPSIFYVTGALAILWSLVWLYVGADSPATHKFISPAERNYIESSLVSSSRDTKVLKTPWKDIATSGPMWALLITHCAQNWGFWTLLTLIPSYINSVLGFNIKSNGLLSALPYLLNWVTTIIISIMADFVNKRHIMPVCVSRKLWNSIGLWGGSVALFLLAQIGKDVTFAIVLVCVAVALNGSTFSGYLCNHIDLAPNFAGVLMGITNCLANSTSILGPLIAGFLITNEESADEWKIVFYLSAGIFLVGNLIFVLFASTEVQRWNFPPQQSETEKPDGSGFGTRHYQALMTSLCMTVIYILSVNMSVGIVAMTDPGAGNPDYPVLNWDTSIKGTILSSFFWGYVVLQIPAGQLSQTVGPKYILGGAVLFCGIMTAVIPPIALSGSWKAVCLTRIAQGLGQGFVVPCVNAHVAKWAPPSEKSRIFSFVFGGTLMGSTISLFGSGLLAAGSGGWPSIFYVSGALAVLWALMWLYFGADSPANHRSISDAERNYIETSLANSSKLQRIKTPWRKIAKSVPVWAILITHCSQNWGSFTLLTLIPSYINSVFGFSIRSNGFLSALPYLLNWITTILMSIVADNINKNKLLPLNVSRKLWNSIGLWGCAVGLVLLAQIERNVTLAVSLVCVSLAINAGVYSGFMCNHIDLSPNFAGVLMGVTNCAATVTSILGPLTAGFIIKNEANVDEWKIVFYISAIVSFTGNLIFVLFASTETQKWNYPKQELTDKPDGSGFGARHYQALMACLGMTLAYILRVNMSVGIVAMTDPDAGNPNYPIPAGQLAQTVGPRYLLGGALLFCGIMTAVIPPIALTGSWVAVCLTRIAQGLGQGFVYPCINAHVAKWAPASEKSRTFSFVFGGTPIGSTISLFGSGLLAAGPGGWPSIFYVSGALAVVWALMWLYFGADSPAKHRSISDAERNYIESSLVNSSKLQTKTPWREIAKSVPVWALLITHFAQNWGFFTLLTLIPSYINSVLGFNIKSNGFLSALPYLLNWVTTILISIVADYINKNKLLPLNVSRKLWNSIGLWGCAIALVLLAQIEKNVTLAVALVCVSVAVNAGEYCGYLCNHIDLSPNFAGVLMGVTNCAANVSSILGPLAAGFIIKNEENVDEWKIVFYISAAVFFVGNLIFVLFASTETQKWNYPKENETDSGIS